ncbi:chorismate mutase [Paracoccus sp. Z330]|uniref:chorismate mutase n=1 Tax=Paracoccus onchidii TaxID=3017813 RepID=A0ABT4ZAN5_9RHOB|nr:chorismate mutase [Paracoccus onchidii]MDB6176428.1 chorismate mutase [Paracoccus onchidii]
MNQFDDIADMTALRLKIDEVDGQLISLLAQRRELIDRAAQIKAREGLPARIDWRVEEVVENARRNARAAGLDPDLIGPIWRALVEAAIAQEDSHLKGNVDDRDAD